jgi:anaerobic selenocysteine-containing dehydrogenase
MTIDPGFAWLRLPGGRQISLVDVPGYERFIRNLEGQTTMQVIKTICQMCYFYCGLDVTVEEGRILKVEGMREHPVNGGRLCAKGLASAQLVTDPKRLKTPLRRIDNHGSSQWEPVSWDQALDEIAEKLDTIRDKFGPEYVGYYRGHAPGWVTNYNYVARLMNFFGSPSIFTHAHLCFAPRAIAHAATFGAPPEPDYEHTNCMVLFGYNPAYTSPVNYVPRIIWAKERGAKLIVIDPRFTPTAAKADLFLQPRPGTTGALTLAMIQVIIEAGLYDADFINEWTVGFDALKKFVQDYTPEQVEPIAWVPADKIRRAAHLMATTRPAVIVDGNGLDQHTNTVQTVRAVSILRALLRTVDEVGGSIMIPHLPSVDVEGEAHRPTGFDDKAVFQYPLYYRVTEAMNGIDLIESITAGKIKALIVQGGDPAAVLSGTAATRETLSKIDFLVVHDLYHTATGHIADMVLPAASFLERDLVLYYRYRPFADGNLIAMQNQCVPPVGESKSDLDLIFVLARRVGLSEHFPWEKVTDAFDWQLEPNNINVAWLREHPGGYVRKYSPEELYRKYEHAGFRTPSHKIEFVSSRFAEQGLDSLPTFVEPAASPVSTPELAQEYPLIGSTSLKLGIHTHTQFRTLPWIQEIEPDPFGELHPRTASELDIQDGDWMIVESPTGCIQVRARVRATVHPRVVMITFGYGEPYATGGDLPNTITSGQERDPIAGATGNRSFLCRVRKAEV